MKNAKYKKKTCFEIGITTMRTRRIAKIHRRYIGRKKTRDGVVLPLRKGRLRNTGYSIARQSISVYFTVCSFIITNQYNISATSIPFGRFHNTS